MNWNIFGQEKKYYLCNLKKQEVGNMSKNDYNQNSQNNQNNQEKNSQEKNSQEKIEIFEEESDEEREPFFVIPKWLEKKK